MDTGLRQELDSIHLESSSNWLAVKRLKKVSTHSILGEILSVHEAKYLGQILSQTFGGKEEQYLARCDTAAEDADHPKLPRVKLAQKVHSSA